MRLMSQPKLKATNQGNPMPCRACMRGGGCGGGWDAAYDGTDVSSRPVPVPVGVPGPACESNDVVDERPEPEPGLGVGVSLEEAGSVLRNSVRLRPDRRAPKERAPDAVTSVDEETPAALVPVATPAAPTASWPPPGDCDAAAIAALAAREPPPGREMRRPRWGDGEFGELVEDTDIDEMDVNMPAAASAASASRIAQA